MMDSAPVQPFMVTMPIRFIVMSLLSVALLAFVVGNTARVILIDAYLAKVAQSPGAVHEIETGTKLPNPVIGNGKVVPRSSYTSKVDTSAAATISSRWIQPAEDSCLVKDTSGQCLARNSSSSTSSNNESTEQIDEEPHHPAGQHLLLDIENIDFAFLNSESRLARAMVELVNQCGLTLLSYHCHSLQPTGVSCAGILLESHVSFHTWPDRGVITLDLFTCGPDSLLPVVPVAKRLFSIARSPSYPGEVIDQPSMVWAHKLRGFRPPEEVDTATLVDIGTFPIGMRIDYKETIASVQTQFQQIDIYDVLRPKYQSLESYRRSLLSDVSYESRNRELFQPDRIIFLDGVLQSRRSGDAAYHEALVHPAMFAHPNPKRVAIIGGGECATLREVLKHNTVENVIMVEIDETMVNLSKQHLAEWSDCSNLIGSHNSCIDDPRTQMHYADAFKWFIDRFSPNKLIEEAQFDVIIMDAPDPENEKDFVDALYSDGPFLQAVKDALNDDGILIAQVGESSRLRSASEDFSKNRNRAKYFRTLIDMGFESVRDYEEGHCGFGSSWEYIVGFKSYETKANWFVSEAVVNLKIRQRSVQTVNGKSPFRYFDGATMMSYKYPSKVSEVVFCRSLPTPEGCKTGHGFDPERTNFPISVLELRESSLGVLAGRGVFTTVDIPQNSYVGLKEYVNIVYMEPSTYFLITAWERYDHFTYENYWGKTLEAFVHTYGEAFSNHGGMEIFAPSTIHAFINHGCNGTGNVGYDLGVTEFDSRFDTIEDTPKELLEEVFGKQYVYNPAVERRVHFFSNAVPRRDISPGEELLDNFLAMIGNSKEDWEEDINGLRRRCSPAERVTESRTK